MEKVFNKIEITSDLLKKLSEENEINPFPVTLVENSVIQIKKDLFLKNKTTSIHIMNLRYHSTNDRELFNYLEMAKSIKLRDSKFHLFQSDLKLFDAATLLPTNIHFNKKPLTITFLVSNKSLELTSIVKFINDILSNLPFTDYSSQIYFNVIFVNFMENQTFIKQKISDKKCCTFYNAYLSEIRKIIDIHISDLPYYFITNKYNKVIANKKFNYNDKADKLQLISYFLPKDPLVDKIKDKNNYKEEFKHLEDESSCFSESSYKEFKEMIKKVKEEFQSRHYYTTDCVFNIKILYDKYTIFTSPIEFTVKYSIPIINDNTYSFVNSRVHKLLLANPVSNQLKMSRFKTANKLCLKEALGKYFSFLSELGLKTNLELRKKTNYNIENVSRSYNIKNSIGKINNNDVLKSYNLSSIFLKLKDLKKTTIANFKSEIFPSLKNIRVKLMYKIFKSKTLKNIDIKCINDKLETITFVTKPGMNYLIYLVKYANTNYIKTFIRIFAAIKQMFIKENVPVELSLFILVEEINQIVVNWTKVIFGEFKKYVDCYFIELTGETKRIFDYTYEYPNKKTFLFVNSEGILNNFNLKISYQMIMEKIFDLINRKREISREIYYKIKKTVKNFIPDYDYSAIKYKPTFNISLEKRTIYNDKMSDLNVKYFVKGNLKINDKDANHLDNILLELKNCTEYGIDFIDQKTILPTFSIDVKTENLCKFCKKECGNFNVYFCPYCNEFICERCANEIVVVLQQKEKGKTTKEAESNSSSNTSIFGKMINMVIEKGVDKHFTIYKQCIFHNLLVIMNIEKIIKAGTNLTFSFRKFGYNMFGEFITKPDIKNNFSCTYCRKTYTNTRYSCLNCKSFDLYYDTVDTNGFIDVCEKCFKNFSDLNKSNNSEISLARVYADEELENENHHFSDHIYARYCYNSGFYFLN